MFFLQEIMVSSDGDKVCIELWRINAPSFIHRMLARGWAGQVYVKNSTHSTRTQAHVPNVCEKQHTLCYPVHPLG